MGKALYELHNLGFIERMPRLAIIQAEGAAPFYELVRSSDRSIFKTRENPVTLATAIRIGSPVSWKKALRALDWTRGAVERVTEQEIADAKAMIGIDGIGCEPASATTLAGLKRLVEAGTIGREEDVVAVLTGNLMKDPSYSIGYHTATLKLDEGDGPQMIESRFANRPVRVPADKDRIKEVMRV
jgi:threonine synthase